MASMSFDWAAYRARLPDDDDFVNWQDADDLDRLSVDAFIAERSSVRRSASSGLIRLTGEGVHGHRAPLEDVAHVMRHFQRAVLASGLATNGFKTLQGRLPADVVNKTILHLDGSALPGSLVLNVVPASPPSSEIIPDGQGEFFRDDEDQLIDRAVLSTLELLNLSKEAGPDADSTQFLEKLTDAGPRVASTLRDLAISLVDSGFNAETSWRRPGHSKTISRMTVSNLAHLASLVASRELASEPTVLIGVVRTVSDISPLRIEISEGQIETVQAGAIPHAVIAGIRVGMTIRVAANVTEEVAPGGEVKTKYTASSIEILDRDEDG